MRNSSGGDEVHVAAGAYHENVNMVTGVNLLGGYSATDWSRDISANETIIDAGGTGNPVTAATAAIDGFTIKGGSSLSGDVYAGVYVDNCSPTISNNRITQNGKYGIYVYRTSSSTIQQNVITGNTLYGIYCYAFITPGTPHIYNNTIDGNLRGIQLTLVPAVIKNNIVTNNTEYGIFLSAFSSPSVDYNDFWSNGQDYYGATPGPHDKPADPLYLGGWDYHLKTSPTLSPCIDAGVDVGLPYIWLPDMGAYESSASQQTPWPPDGLRGTPRSTMVRLDWLANREPDIAGYKVSYGNVPGSYSTTLDVGKVTEFDVRNLINDATCFFAVRAYDTANNTSGYSAEISSTPTAGAPELPHYDWDGSYAGGDCAACHFRNTGAGELLPSGYDYRYSGELCLSCHNATAQARAKDVIGPSNHPVYVNATTNGDNLPTYGNITGRYSNRMGDHLKPGNVIVCNTCHNAMEKAEDPGRTWELTADEGDHRNFDLQRGGWSWYGYMRLDVYSSTNLTPAPSYVKDRRSMKAAPALYGYDIDAGKITFGGQFYNIAYASLRYPYLRVDNSDNAMCLDCHNTGTHQLINCLTCHEAHGYSNRHGIRPSVMTPVSGMKTVVFKGLTGHNSFADGDGVYDGICEVCHTKTSYYRNDGTGFTNHSSGLSYAGKDCTACHTHVSGFSRR